MDTWSLAEKITDYVRSNDTKLTDKELTNAIDDIIREHFNSY